MKLGKKVVGLIATGFLLAACGGTKEAAEKVDSGNLAAEQKISISRNGLAVLPAAQDGMEN